MISKIGGIGKGVTGDMMWNAQEKIHVVNAMLEVAPDNVTQLEVAYKKICMYQA